MNRPTWRDALPRWTPGGALLRVLVVALPVAALLLTAPLGTRPGPWVLAATTFAALAWAVWPRSPMGILTLGLVVLWWGLLPVSGVPALVVPAAVLLLGAHLAAQLATYGPGEMGVDPALAWLWVRRGLATALAAPLTFAALALLQDQPAPAWAWVGGLAAGCLLLLSAQWAMRAR